MSVSLNTEWVWFTAGIFPVSVWCLLYKTQLLAWRHLITFPMLTSQADVSQMSSAPSFTTGFLCDIREIIWSHCTVSPSVKHLPEPSPTPWSFYGAWAMNTCGNIVSEENLWCSLPPPLHHPVPEHGGIVKQMLLFLWQRWLLISLSFCVWVFFLKKIV